MGLGPNPSSSKKERETNTNTPQVYKEHKNRETVKGVNFYGPKCEYVVSGSDCGRLFIWRKKDGELLRAMEADKHVVNCVESHPHMPLMCSSGIERDIKIWTPEGNEKQISPRNAKQALVSGNRRWFLFYDEEGEDQVFNNTHEIYDDDDDDDDDDSDDELSDDSSDDDDDGSEEDEVEEENGKVDVLITKNDDDDDNGGEEDVDGQG